MTTRTQHMLIFQASTQSLLPTTANTRALQLGNVITMGHSYNRKLLSKKQQDPLPPASCHLRGLVNVAWQVEEAQTGGSDTLRVHFMAFWRRPDQRTGEQVGGCLGLQDGYCGVMRCSLECGVMALSTLVKRCRSVC